MNYKRVALGLVCGLLCVAPAFAGVVDADLTSTTETRDSTHLTSKDVDKSTTKKSYTTSGWANVWRIDSEGNWDHADKIDLSGHTADTLTAAYKAAYGDLKSEAGRGGWAYGYDNWGWTRDKVEAQGGHVYDNHMSRLQDCGGNFFTWSNGTLIDKQDNTTTTKKEKKDYKAATVTTSNYLFVGDVDDFSNTYEIGGEKLITHHDGWWNEKTGSVTEVYQVDVWGYVSPIILDLDGDGAIQASNGKYLAHPDKFDFSCKLAMFDFQGNGFPVLTEWVGENDGLLCRPEADGSVSGVNLFGTANGSKNGYEDMSILDANENGALEGAELEGLYVWQDGNRNGVADEGELSTVQALGITSISVKHDNMTSTFVRNGQTFKSFDWWPSVKDVRRVKVSTL
jgi:hypothetical protein